MAEQPRTFTAPESGRYHVASGREPHPVADCTDECQPDAMFTAVLGSKARILDSGAPVKIPMDVVTVPWGHP